jgi:CHAT domain-containing protein
MKLFLLLLFSAILISNFARGQTWKAYLDSANDYKITNQNEKALDYYNKARNILIADSSNSTTIADLNDSLAAIYLTQQNYKGAEALYLESKQIRALLYTQNSLPYAQSCFDLGYIYTQFITHYNEAIRLLDTTRMILETHSKKESLQYAFALKYSGTSYNRTGEDQKALKSYLEAITIIDAILGEENLESAKILANIGNIYRNTGNYLTSETYYKDAISLFEKLAGKQSYFYLATVNNLANLYYQCFQAYKALPILLTTKKTIEGALGKNSSLYYYNLGLLGQVYRELDNLDLAEKYFTEERNYDKTSSGEENENYAANCFNFGRLYFYMGQYEKSERFYLQSKQLWEKLIGKNTTDYTWCCTDLAQLYIKMGKFEKAESLLLEARQIIEYREGRNNGFIEGCKNLGNLYILTRQYKKAERVLIEGKEVVDVRSYGNSYQNFEISSSLGDLNLFKGNYEEAKRYYNTCRFIIEQGNISESTDHVETLKKLAILDWCQHQTDSSLSMFSRCLSLQRQGLQKIFQFTSQTEKQSFVSKVSDLADYYFSFALNSSSRRGLGIAYNTSFSNRNIILESFEQLNKAIYNSGDTLQKRRYQEWLDTKRELANYYSHSTGQNSNISALEEKANQQEKNLTSFISSIQKDRGLTQITWKKIQNKLLPNEAAIEFLSFRYYDAYRRTDSVYYAALIVRKGLPEPEMVRLFEQKVLDSILNNHISKSDASQISSLYTRGVPIQGNISMDKSIYDIVWKPIESKLKGIKTIYFALAGALHKISFAALPIDAHTFLSDQYELIQLDNTASILDNAVYTVKKTDRVQLFGGVNYDTDSTESLNRDDDQESKANTRSSGNGLTWGFLPGTQKEITNISTIGKNKHFTISVSLGTAASEESIKSLNGAASPEILHIATHGFFFPDPKEPGVTPFDSGQNGNAFRQSQDPLLRSGLILAGANIAWKGNITANADDGILTAYEISNMYLPHTKLVVLSACETALGDIKGSEGVYGLQRAFKMAGVQNLVMSLWKVPDEETSEFMDLFYQYMFSGQPINSAFYLAQSDMKNKYRNMPFKWAAWILIR